MKIKNWFIIVVLVCLVLGTLLHFTYEWSGEDKIVAIYSAVNESTWEHLKLVFYPMTIMAIIGTFVIKKQKNNNWAVQAIGILTSMTFITVFIYTFTEIIGKNFAILDIASFIVAILLGEYVTYKIITSEKKYDMEKISIVLIIALFLSFLVYTYNPPKIQYFKDPINGSYGVK